jgi:hypothetical protein
MTDTPPPLLTETDGPLLRPDYGSGGLMTAADYAADQDYHLQIQRRRNRTLSVSGVVDGMDLTVAAQGPFVTVSPGLALDGRGRQILLTAARRIDLSSVYAPEVWLTVSADVAYDRWRDYGSGSGWTRIEDVAGFGWPDGPPEDPDTAIVLARLTFLPNRSLREPDLSVRRWSGLQVGALVFPRPGVDEANWPSLTVAPSGDGLQVAASRTDVFGSMLVRGPVAVGGASAAAVTVNREPPEPGQGLVSSDGDVIYGQDAADLSSLLPGDILHVAAPQGSVDLQVVKVLGSQTVQVTPAPSPAFALAPYAFVRQAVFRVLTGELTEAFVVGQAGVVALGGPPTDAAVAIYAGDLKLSDPGAAGAAVRFQGAGGVQATSGQHAVRFDPAPVVAAPATASPSLSVVETGSITLATGTTSTPPVTMTLTDTRCVGVGTTTPTSALTVNGVIHATGGLVFPDGSRQTDAVVAIPIGTVLDWWRPDAQSSWSGDGFQLCDGSTITDPASPLVGQKTPDLRDRFVRGVVSFEQIGSTGGAATHSHEVVTNTHTHDMSHHHMVSGSTGPASRAKGDALDSWSSISHADHTHTFNVSSGVASPSVTLPNTSAGTTTTSVESNIPPNMALLKVMRIK